MSDTEKKKDVLRQTDDDARTLAKALIFEANMASLACLCPETGHPLISRTAFAVECDGTPLILVSELSAHTSALMKDKRCSLLFGETGRGDPLAYPRISVECEAEHIDRQSEERKHIRSTYLLRNPKAELYVDFGDFHFFRLHPKKASLNGGFGKAYALEQHDLVLPPSDLLEDFKTAINGVIEHMNDDHGDAIADYARMKGKDGDQNWRMTSLNPEAMVLASNDDYLRFVFNKPMQSASQIRAVMVKLAKEARA